MPRSEFKSWPKNDLVREVERLRAILKEHADAPGDAPAQDGGNLVDVPGDPFARGGVVLDTRNAVLLAEVDVCLVDTKRDEPPRLALLLQGRINFREEHARQLYLMNEDGAAAIVTQLLALARRIGPEFEARFVERLQELEELGPGPDGREMDGKTDEGRAA